ncbi:hypothetical protein L3X38_036065 [Prunus dulcis]|uniref:Uncharacterized protein n=1 Tax=Prunus dulcis TaxID=3755 RepID=A0AAD4YPZ8_PRUDU|nr:hypothetical protein L3X38_036065 [Prunus dulcis]
MGSNVKLMIAEKNKFHGKALSLSYTKTAITAIKEKFSSEQLERFKGSCFGHLLLIEDLKWTPQIVHGLLLRKVDPKTVKTVKGKGCRKKQPITVLLSPFIGPMRKKRKLPVSEGTGTPTAFNPTKPVPIEDVKAVIDFCTTWKSNMSVEVRLEEMAVGQEFFYKLINDSLWMTSSHLDMGMFLIRKRQFAHPLAVGTDWTTADCCLQSFLEPVKLPPKK